MPLPQGYVLDQTADGGPGVKLPPGYSLDKAPFNGVDHKARLAALQTDPRAHGDPRAEEESALEKYAPQIAHPLDTLGGVASTMAGGIQGLLTPLSAMAGDQQARSAALERMKARGMMTDDPEQMRDAFEFAVPLVGPAFASAGRAMNSQHSTERANGFGSALALTSGSELGKEFAGDAARVALPTKEGATAQYAKVLDPKAENPQAATKAATSLIDERKTMNNPAQQLPEYAEGKANAIDTRTPILDRATEAKTTPITDEIAQQRDALFNPIAEIPLQGSKTMMLRTLRQRFPDARLVIKGDSVAVEMIRHPDMKGKVAALNRAENHIRNSGTTDGMDTVSLPMDNVDAAVETIRKNNPDAQVTVEPGWGWDRGDMGEAVVSYTRAPKVGEAGTLNNQTLANLHQDYNYAANKSGAFKENSPNNPVRMPADANVASAVRNVVNQDPKAAAANAQKSAWLDVKDLRPSEAKEPGSLAGTAVRVAAKTGASALVHALAGPTAGHIATALLGGHEALRYVRNVMDSPGYKTWSAVKKAQFADAVKAGDLAKIGQIAGIAAPSAGGMNEQELTDILQGQ